MSPLSNRSIPYEDYWEAFDVVRLETRGLLGSVPRLRIWMSRLVEVIEVDWVHEPDPTQLECYCRRWFAVILERALRWICTQPPVPDEGWKGVSHPGAFKPKNVPSRSRKISRRRPVPEDLWSDRAVVETQVWSCTRCEPPATLKHCIVITFGARFEVGHGRWWSCRTPPTWCSDRRCAAWWYLLKSCSRTGPRSCPGRYRRSERSKALWRPPYWSSWRGIGIQPVPESAMRKVSNMVLPISSSRHPSSLFLKVVKF